MERSYHWQSLKRFFNIGWFRYTRKAGVDSGYPACCIGWFWVRSLSLHIYGAIFGNVKPFQRPVKSFRSKLELRIYQNSTAYKRETKHVCCPFHAAIFFLTKKEHHYIMCKECGWIQYEVAECNNCAQHDFYETKQRRRGRGV